MYVEPGKRTGDFLIAGHAGSTPETYQITAEDGVAFAQTNVTLNPLRITGFNIEGSSTAAAGSFCLVTIKLNAPTLEDYAIQTAPNDPNVWLPSGGLVTVPAGAKTLTTNMWVGPTVTSFRIACDSFNGQSFETKTIKVVPYTIKTMTLASSSIRAGETTTCTITVNGLMDGNMVLDVVAGNTVGLPEDVIYIPEWTNTEIGRASCREGVLRLV